MMDLLNMLNLSNLKTWIKEHKTLSINLFLSLLTALSILWGAMLYKDNKKLSESLEIANNNIEAYLDIVSNTLLANGVLKLDMLDILNCNDSLIQKIDSVRKENKIKTSALLSAATQTQSLVVSKLKGVGGYIEVIKDTIYTDSILYNPLTKVYYTIGNDTIKIDLDVLNTQYLYTYKTREYKNKKNFLKRLFTLHFKKVDRYKYTIVNSNDLIKESDIRIIELK